MLHVFRGRWLTVYFFQWFDSNIIKEPVINHNFILLYNCRYGRYNFNSNNFLSKHAHQINTLRTFACTWGFVQVFWYCSGEWERNISFSSETLDFLTPLHMAVWQIATRYRYWYNIITDSLMKFVSLLRIMMPNRKSSWKPFSHFTLAWESMK